MVLSRLTGELREGEGGSMAIILVLFQFTYSPTLAAASRRIQSASSSFSVDSFRMAKSSEKSTSMIVHSPNLSPKLRREAVFVIM